MENSHNGININIKALQNILKSSEDVDFLSKYDKDKNSIFSKEEIAELSDDLIKFASKDGKADTLSVKEALDFYNYTMSKNDSQDVGRPTTDNPTDNTIKSRTTNGNSLPSPSDNK